MAIRLEKAVKREALALTDRRGNPIIVALEPGDEVSLRGKGTRRTVTVSLAHILKLAQVATAAAEYREKMEVYNRRLAEAKVRRTRKPVRPRFPYNRLYLDVLGGAINTKPEGTKPPSGTPAPEVETRITVSTPVIEAINHIFRETDKPKPKPAPMNPWRRKANAFDIKAFKVLIGALAKRHKIRIVGKFTTAVGRAYVKQRFVEVPKVIDTAEKFMIALHEIGHIVAPHSVGYIGEYEAENWAIATAGAEGFDVEWYRPMARCYVLMTIAKAHARKLNIANIPDRVREFVGYDFTLWQGKRVFVNGWHSYEAMNIRLTDNETGETETTWLAKLWGLPVKE